jgi:hypothetical protein
LYLDPKGQYGPKIRKRKRQRFVIYLLKMFFSTTLADRQVWDEFQPVPTPAEATLHRPQINGGGGRGGGGGQQAVEARVPLYQLLSGLH